MTGEGIEQDEQVVTPPPPKGKEPETLAIPKADWDRVNRRLAEVEESERVWAQRARGQKPEPEQEDEEIDTDGLVPKVTGDEDLDAAIFADPEKWTDALTKGPQAIGKYIKSLGLVSAKEAAEIAVKAARQEVQHTVRGMQADSELVSEYKEMKDPNSELFKTASPIYQKLVAMNNNKHSSALIFAAAGQAKAILEAKAPPARPRSREDDYDRYEPEEDRRARARAQGSESRRAPVVDEEVGDLGPEALAICKMMGVSAEEYSASQKQLGTRGRR